MDRVGIELQLKSNLEQQLKTIMPLLTNMNKQFDSINRTMLKMEDMQKKTIGQFDKMASSISNVGRKERELQSVSRQVSNVGQAASKSAGLMGGLTRSIGTVVAAAGPLLGLYKIMQGISAGAGAGLDFQNKLIGLGNRGFTAGQVSDIKQYALDTSASGKTILTPSDFLDIAQGAQGIVGRENVRGALPQISKYVDAARRSNIESKNPEVLTRFWEIFAKRSPSERDKLDEVVLKAGQGYNITPEALLGQLSTYGGGLIGRDPAQAILETAYLMKESGSGLKGGGGGRSRAGFIGRSLDAMINQGIVKQGTRDLWFKEGRLPGIEKYMTQKGGSGSSLVATDEHGHSMSVKHMGRGNKGGAYGQGSIPNAVWAEYMASPDRPEWMKRAGRSDEELANQFVMMAAQHKGFKGSPLEQMNQFRKLSDADQKQAVMSVSGLNLLQSSGIIEMGGVGRTAKSLEQFHKTYGETPGFNVSGQESVQQKFQDFTAQFDAFMTKFVNTPEIMSGLNTTMAILNGTMKLLNDNVGFIAHWLGKPAELAGRVGNQAGAAASNAFPPNYNPGTGEITWPFGIKSQVPMGSTAMDAVQKNSAKFLYNAAMRYGIPPDILIAGSDMESSLNPLKLGPNVPGMGRARGLAQLMPWGTKTAGGSITDDQAFNPVFASENLAKRMDAVRRGAGDLGGYPSAGAWVNAAQRAYAPGQKGGAAWMQSIDADRAHARQIIVEITGPLKPFVQATAVEVHKQNKKTALKMGDSASGAGGSYAHKEDYSGRSH